MSQSDIDYQQELMNSELAVDDECDHVWEHYYNFMACKKCQEDHDIPTSSDYLKQ
jgi:hypothetical protein